MEEKKNNKWKIIVGVFISVALLLAMCVMFYIHFKKDPVQIFKTTVNDLYSKFDNTLHIENEDSVMSNETIKMSGKLKLNSNIEGYTDYNDIEFGVDSYINSIEEKLLMNVFANKSNENIIKATLAYIENNEYFKWEEILDKTILIGNANIFQDEESLIEVNGNSLNLEDLSYVVKSLKDIFLDSLDKRYFKVNDAKLTIKDKEISVEKYTYVVDEDNLLRTDKYITERILEDRKLISSLANLSGVSEEEMEELLREDLEDEVEEDFKTIYISIYMKNNEFVSFSMEDSDFSIQYSDFNGFEFIIKGNEFEIKIYEDTDDIKFYMKSLEEELLKGNLVVNDNEVKLVITIISEGIPIDLFLEMSDFVFQDNLSSFDISLGMKMNVFGEEFKLSIDGEYQLEVGVDMPEFDLGNVVSSEDLTEEELQNMMLKFNEIISKLGINDLISSEV